MARGLVHRPNWLWVDEPTASLDSLTGRMVMEVLRGQTQHGALIVITHDPEILDDANMVFKMRDGALVAEEGKRSVPEEERRKRGEEERFQAKR